jgi:hypothetical protein
MSGGELFLWLTCAAGAFIGALLTLFSTLWASGRAGKMERRIAERRAAQERLGVRYDRKDR